MLVWCSATSFLSRFLATGHLIWVSQSCLSDDKVDEMEAGAVHRSPGIYFAAEENLKTLARRPLKAMKLDITSNGILTTKEIVRITQHIMEREGRKKEQIYFQFFFYLNRLISRSILLIFSCYWLVKFYIFGNQIFLSWDIKI